MILKVQDQRNIATGKSQFPVPPSEDDNDDDHEDLIVVNKILTTAGNPTVHKQLLLQPIVSEVCEDVNLCVFRGF
jgi:hypothetical protein